METQIYPAWCFVRTRNVITINNKKRGWIKIIQVPIFSFKELFPYISSQAEVIEDDRLEKIAQALGISPKAIDNFKEDALLFHIQHMHNQSTAYAYNFQCTYNPLDKVVELYERLLRVEREKVELLKKRLADSQAGG